MPHTLTLRRPRLDEEDEFMRAHLATLPDVPNFLHYYTEGMPLVRYLDILNASERGVNLPPDQVPSTFLFAFAGPRIIGRVSIRHWLHDFLERVGGHIGYAVVPEFRRQGFGTEMLRLSLTLARDSLGLNRVLLTCDDDNVGSIKVIERNGGVLENVVIGPEVAKPKRRYWIDLRA
jgi:predicted acetyltransferase